jgi:uncharacterized protein YndB with AHSA1/START domain
VSEDRIERDTLIEAPLERVWSLVATPGFWVADEESVAGTVATEGASLIAKNPNLGEVAVRVEKVEPPTYVAYRWASAFPGEGLREDNSTLVEFTLTSEDGKTRLRVVESGFSTLNTSEDLRENAVRFNTEGWPQVFDMLKGRVEQTSV